MIVPGCIAVVTFSATTTRKTKRSRTYLTLINDLFETVRLGQKVQNTSLLDPLYNESFFVQTRETLEPDGCGSHISPPLTKGHRLVNI